MQHCSGQHGADGAFSHGDSSGATVAYTTHGRAYNFYDPSNAQTMNAALVAIIYGQLITPPTDVQPFVSIPVPMTPKTAQEPALSACFYNGSARERGLCIESSRKRQSSERLCG